MTLWITLIPQNTFFPPSLWDGSLWDGVWPSLVQNHVQSTVMFSKTLSGCCWVTSSQNQTWVFRRHVCSTQFSVAFPFVKNMVTFTKGALVTSHGSSVCGNQFFYQSWVKDVSLCIVSCTTFLSSQTTASLPSISYQRDLHLCYK